MQDPIVVTGMGAVSPLGGNVAASWRRLLAGESGIVANTRFAAEGLACRIAGLVPDASEDADGFDPDAAMSARDRRRNDLFIQYAAAAAQEALDQAAWRPTDGQMRARTATVIATGVGGFPGITQAMETVRVRGSQRLSPFVIPSFLPNLAAGQIAIRYGFNGPTGAPVTACAASAQAIGDAMRLIRAGEADIALCGGAEACVDPVAIGGFCAARALSTGYNDRPALASRPFDAGHDGFVLAEGAALLVVERHSHARARGAPVLAEIAGYGTTTDGHHVTAGWPDGREAARAIRMALEMAGIGPTDVGYVNAHSTSTPVGDAAELAALDTVFGTRAGAVALSATKSATGHMLGAAGAIEAIFSVLALTEGMLPPGLNLEAPIAGAEAYDLVTGPARRQGVDHVLSNAFGFGGVNAALVFRRRRA